MRKQQKMQVGKPMLKPYTLPSRTSQHANQNLAKSMAFPNADCQAKRKNNEGTTFCISNGRQSAKY